LDALVVDLPPGTGDAQLTMAQQTPTSGAVIVSTPQDLALIDARRGIAMFQKVDVPLLGIIENMSSFCCPNCGHISPIFGHGGARAEATKLGVPFLGEVPLDMNIRETSDDGRPVVATDPDSLLSNAAVARRIGASRSWVEHHYAELPPRVSLVGRPRWRSADIDRWVANRPRFGECQSVGRTGTAASATAGAAGGSATAAVGNASKSRRTAARGPRR
jgi:predicted DNA-binding transcriptional regulator AlpA